MKTVGLKDKKHTVVAAVIAFLISLLVCVAIFLPGNIGNVLDVDGNPIEILGVSQIKTLYECKVDPDGSYTIKGDDPQIIFSCKGQEIECLKINIVSSNAKGVPFELYTAFSDGAFSAERCYGAVIFKGKQSCVVELPKGEYYSIRIDIDSDDVRFKSLELYEQKPIETPFVPERTVADYLKAILIPLAISLVVWFADKRTQFVKKSLLSIKNNKIKILYYLVYSVLAVLVGVLIELLIGLSGDGIDFNRYRAVFLCGFAELVVVFILERKNLSLKPEKMFLPVVLVLGAVMLFGSPIKHISWDLDSHYPWATQMSFIDTAYTSAAEYNIDRHMDQSMFLDGFSLESYEKDIDYLNEADKTITGQADARFSLAHLPAGVFIALARLFGASFEFKYNFGRLAYLIVYAFACYFAIKKLKSGKTILAVICLFPTNLFLATNYAYDWCVTAFTMLGTAYFVSELQQPDKPISVKDTLIMGVSFVAGAWSKLVYVILMGMTLFMRKNWKTKKEKRKYYIILISIFLALFAYFIITTLVKVGGEGDTRGGAVNPSAQIAGIFADPFGYIKILFKFLSQYLSFGATREYISHFAYLGIGKYWIIFTVMMIVVALTDANDNVNFKIPLYMKGLAILLFVGMAALIATALYINFTPLNAQTINGCQPRYLTPLLAPLLLLVTGQRFNVIKNKAVYNGAVFTVLSMTVMFETYSMIITKMI